MWSSGSEAIQLGLVLGSKSDRNILVSLIRIQLTIVFDVGRLIINKFTRLVILIGIIKFTL